jgi:transcriptional regulator with XRE-family HTH domain
MQGTLARKLRVLRAKKGLTLRQAASGLGVTPGTLSELERGVRHPHDVTLSKISKGYGVSFEELLVEEGELAAPLGETPQAGRPNVVEVAQDAARKQIAQDAEPGPPVVVMHHENEGARRLREEYGLSGVDAEALIDYVCGHERKEAGRRSRQGAGRPSSREAVADPTTD